MLVFLSDVELKAWPVVWGGSSSALYWVTDICIIYCINILGTFPEIWLLWVTFDEFSHVSCLLTLRKVSGPKSWVRKLSNRVQTNLRAKEKFKNHIGMNNSKKKQEIKAQTLIVEYKFFHLMSNPAEGCFFVCCTRTLWWINKNLKSISMSPAAYFTDMIHNYQTLAW